MLDLHDLTARFGDRGRVDAIYLRPQRGVAAVGVESAEAVEGRGLIGDRSAERLSSMPGGSKRQVTLLQAEHVPLIAAWTGRAALDAAVLRRNLVIAGLNLASARSPFADQVLHVLIGDSVALVVTGDCAPCSKMEVSLGRGGYNALRGHGGVTARIVRGGLVRVGDAVRVETVDATLESEAVLAGNARDIGR